MIIDSTPNPSSTSDDQSVKMRHRALDQLSIQSLEKDLMNAVISPEYAKNTKDETESGTQSTSQRTSTGTQFTMESLSLGPPKSIPEGDDPGHYAPTARPTAPPPQNVSCCMRFATPLPRIQAPHTTPTSAYSIAHNCFELLPPQSSIDRGRITLVLDLDETLVHSTFMAIPHADFSFVIGFDNNSLGVYVCVRPGVDDFLASLSKIYEVVIFTASNQYYADTVIDHIDPHKCIRHRLYKESCTDFNGCFVKDLSRLGRDLKKIIIVDNSSVAYLLHPYNAIAISSWFDDPSDRDLEVLKDFLLQISDSSDVYQSLGQK